MGDQHTIQMIADNMTATSNENRNLIKRITSLEKELEYINDRLDKIESEQYKPEYMPDPTRPM